MFANSLTYLFEHSEEGAAGLVVNKALNMTMQDVFEQLELPGDSTKASEVVLAGGPVSPHQGFVMHSDGEWNQTLNVCDGLCISTSLDILRALATNEGPEEAICVLGYAGWGPGQLEQEVADNAWLTLQADPDIIFNTSMLNRADRAAKTLGVDINKLGLHAGHA